MRLLTAITALLATAACGGGGGNTTPPPTTNPPAGNSTLIWEIQGSGDSSPLVGQVVTVTATVTGDFQENDADTRRNLRGFYVQDSPDGDLATSDAIFVFDGTNPGLDVEVGDLVEVEGTVQEYFGETQIEADSVRVVGFGALIPFPMNLFATTTTTNSDGQPIADLEHLEGTFVEFSDTLTVTNVHNLERYGEVVLSEGGRLFRFTNDSAPDNAGFAAHAEEAAARSIVLDDGLRDQNPDPIHYLDAGSAPGYSIRLGDTVTGLTGVLRYSRGSGGDGFETWRLEPTIDPEFTSVNPRPGTPTVGGSLVVGGFNVLNFFTTIDTGADICGPAGDEGCRGADNATEYGRQLDKTVTQFIESGADILGLTELENNSSASLLSLIHISEPTRPVGISRMPSSA